MTALSELTLVLSVIALALVAAPLINAALA
jgi:hypothetical protein